MWSTGLLVGMLFGFTLHRARLTSYSTVMGTLLMKDLKAMKFMFTGVAVASFLYGLGDLLGWGPPPRINGYFGIGHLAGGFIFGIGMGLGGICPGTCGAAVGAGQIVTAAGLAGAMAGVFLYDAFFPLVSGLGGEQRFITWPVLLGVRYGYLALAQGVMLLAMVFLFDRFDPARKPNSPFEDFPRLRGEWGWLVTGAMAGVLVVLATALGNYLSFSGAFLALGAHLSTLFSYQMQSVAAVNEVTAWRALLLVGLIPGALISSHLAGTVVSERRVPRLFQEAFGTQTYRRAAMVFVSAVLLVFGALIGGGCTTGAFIAGWPTLSVGSYAMGMTFFGTAMLTGRLLFWGKAGLFRPERSAGSGGPALSERLVVPAAAVGEGGDR